MKIKKLEMAGNGGVIIFLETVKVKYVFFENSVEIAKTHRTISYEMCGKCLSLASQYFWIYTTYVRRKRKKRKHVTLCLNCAMEAKLFTKKQMALIRTFGALANEL